MMKDLLQRHESSWPVLPGWCNIQNTGIVKWISFGLTFAILNLSIGCRSYFKVDSSPKPSSEKIAGLNDAGKTVIVHFNEKKWILSDVQIKNNVLTGKLNEYNMPPTIKPVRPNKANRYFNQHKPGKNQKYLIKEVHLYLDEFADAGNNSVSIPVSSINKIEIYDKDTGATVGSWVLGGLGITAGALLVIGAIVALTKESCPFIYTWDGDSYHFAGEIYSGTIHKPLERNDYLKLPTYPGQKSYTLKITNEVREIQNTNLLELLVFDHPENIGVMVDKYGNVITLSQPVAPSLATNLAGENITNLVSSKDDQFYQCKSLVKDSPLKDGLNLEFPNNMKAKSALLVIRAKNSIILDHMLGKFHDMFGTAYNGFMKKQQKASAVELRQWSLDQGIPLSVFVQREGKWEFVDYYNIAGPMAFKDDVLSIPLKGNEPDPLRVKLEFGNFMWEIDNVSIDYSPNQKVTSYTIPVKTAVSEAQKNVADLLIKDDSKYYTQPATDNQAVVTFDLPEPTEKSRTMILHSKGWYQILRNPSGKPNFDSLKVFRNPGQFNRFVNDQMKIMELQVVQAQ